MKEKIKKMLPNIITLSRVIALVLGFILFIKEKTIIAICLYVYGSVSDAFDGYLARKFSASTKIGSYLDAISDKFYALSIIILGILNKNYLIILIAVLELIITIINYITLKKNKENKTERVGKFKMTFEFLTLIFALLSIKVKELYYVFILFLILTLYFGVQGVNAYINQLHNKKQKLIITEKDYKGKSSIEKGKILLKEFKYYLLHPVKIIK